MSYPTHVWDKRDGWNVCLRCEDRWRVGPGHPDPIEHVDRRGVKVPSDVRNVCDRAAGQPSATHTEPAFVERYCREATIKPPAGMPPCECTGGLCTVAAGLTCRCSIMGRPWSPETCPIHRPTVQQEGAR